MYAALMLLAFASSSATVLTVEPGTQLVFQGSFLAEKGSPADTEKKFTLSVLIAPGEARAAQVYWTLEEEGRGGWSWIHRYGHYDAARPAEDALPTLLYERAEGTSVVPLLSPLFVRDEPLAAGSRWQADRFQHEVTGDEKFGDSAAWRVDVKNAYGLKRSMLIDQNSSIVVSLRENVFIGQGEKHELRFELVSRTQLGPEQTQSSVAAFDGFMALRQRLGVEPGARDLKWNAERLALLREQLAPAVQLVQGGPLTVIADEAQRDAKDQRNRAGAVDLLRGKLTGKAAPQPNLHELSGKPFDWARTTGKVTVLHFWEYRETPLEEPYGQIAYLDFLYRNRPSDEVQVFGVCANPLLQDPETRSRAVISVKKLLGFMNLSYPLLADHNGGIKEFGDPRITGAKLPLFVVIDKQGQVVHYHVGTYEVNRDRGLEELEQVVKQALAKSAQ